MTAHELSINLRGRFDTTVVINRGKQKQQEVLTLNAEAGIKVNTNNNPSYSAFIAQGIALVGVLRASAQHNSIPVWSLEVNVASMQRFEEYGAELIHELLFVISRAPISVFEEDQPRIFIITYSYHNKKLNKQQATAAKTVFDQLWEKAKGHSDQFQYDRIGGGLSITPRAIQLTYMPARCYYYCCYFYFNYY